MPLLLYQACARTLAQSRAPFDSLTDEHFTRTFPLCGSFVQLAVTGILVVAVLVTIRRIALRPFSAPEQVTIETLERRETSSLTVDLSTSTLLLVLGAAWSFIGDAGSGSVGVGIPGQGDFAWSAGYADVAPALSVLGFLAQTAAATLLLIGARRVPRAAESVARESSAAAMR